MVDLLVAPCSTEAALYAVRHWHYTGSKPGGDHNRLGVWENDEFVGAVIYSTGASPHLGTAYDLDQHEVCELTRVALREHSTPVSQIVADTLRQLRTMSPGLRLVVSFADPAEGHAGKIYQAGNWIYSGRTNPVQENYWQGRWRHVRATYRDLQGRQVPTRTRPGKHRYLMPLDRQTRRRVERLAQPYPTE